MPILSAAQKLLLEQRLAVVAGAAPYTLRNETFATPVTRPTHISTHGYFALTGPIGESCRLNMVLFLSRDPEIHCCTPICMLHR